MAYDRYDRGDNDGRSRNEGFRGRDEGPERRFQNDHSDQGNEDRGFFERARDEVTSWFGDEEAERRRMMDDRMRDAEDDNYRRHGGERDRSERDRGGSYRAGQNPPPPVRREQPPQGAYDRGGRDSLSSGRSDQGRDRSSAPYAGTMNQPAQEPRGGRSDYGSDRGRGPSELERIQSRFPRSSSDLSRDSSRDRDDDRGGRVGTGFGGQDMSSSQYGRQEFTQDQGSDRPGAGFGRGYADDRDSRRQTYGASNSGGIGDMHYQQLRQRHLEELDRDYDEYRREHQSRFENEFSGWRQQRQTKRQMLDSLRENMEVVGSDGQRIGTFDKVRGDMVVLNRKDPEAGGVHRSFSYTLLERIEGDRVTLGQPSGQVMQQLQTDDRGESGGGWGKALFGGRSNESEGRSARLDEGQGEGDGPHILDQSFSGTYEEKKDR